MKEKKEEAQKDHIEITPATMRVVNQRMLVQAFAGKPIQDPVTKIWTNQFTLINEKTGKTKEVPRFFVAKTATDLPITPEKAGPLPVGTEVFPFIPPAEDFQFPEVFDPGSLKKYIMLEWMELTGYILPDAP